MEGWTKIASPNDHGFIRNDRELKVTTFGVPDGHPKPWICAMNKEMGWSVLDGRYASAEEAMADWDARYPSI